MKRTKLKNYRKGIRLTIALLCVVFCAGCGVQQGVGQKGMGRQEEESEKKLQVVTTIFPLYDFVRQIGKGKVEVHMLLSPGMESHSYEPTPQDMIEIAESDVFFYIGGESDVWVEELLDSLDGKTEAYALMETVETVEEKTPEGAYVRGHRHESHDETEYDEHIWTSPKKVMELTGTIEEILCRADAAHAEEYQENAAEYQKELGKLNDDYENIIENGKRKELIFGDRFPFRYFAEDYGLSYYAAFPGCSSETEPSAATIAFLINRVKEDEIPVVFYLELSNHKIADAVAESAGAETLRFHSCHNITKAEMNSGATYISLMRENLQNLKEALR